MQQHVLPRAVCKLEHILLQELVVALRVDTLTVEERAIDTAGSNGVRCEETMGWGVEETVLQGRERIRSLMEGVHHLEG